jgi:glycosyltransferase involved in cell wall biosynthesis
VVHGVTGLHVPPKDPTGLADALGRLLENPGWRAELGRAGRRRAEDRYSWGRVADGTLAVYQSVQRRSAKTRRAGLS